MTELPPVFRERQTNRSLGQKKSPTQQFLDFEMYHLSKFMRRLELIKRHIGLDRCFHERICRFANMMMEVKTKP